MNSVAAEKKERKSVVKPRPDPMNEQTDKWFAEFEAILSPYWSARLGL